MTGGEQPLAGIMRAIWEGKRPRARSREGVLRFTDDTTVVVLDSQTVEGAFRGEGTLGICTVPELGLQGGVHEEKFFTVRVSWADKGLDQLGPDFLKFRCGSRVAVKAQGTLVEYVFAGDGLLVIQRVVEVRPRPPGRAGQRRNEIVPSGSAAAGRLVGVG